MTEVFKKNKAYGLTIELASVNALEGRLCICRDSCPTELVTPISSTSIESSDVFPRKEGAFQRLSEVEVLDPTMGTTNGLAVVGEEVEALFRMNYKLRAGGAL
jgi:hypothetical protein